MASMSPDRPDYPRLTLAGWGRTNPTGAWLARVHCPDDLVRALTHAPERGVIARGLGRSYGDASQNAGGLVIDSTGAAQFLLDPDTGVVTASAGASIQAILEGIVPYGFFVPVTPGTRFVTVGGAIASDIHGKNHHRAGSWCDHVLSFRLALPDGSVLDVDRDRHPKVFWATAGGMGLTGVITEATFRCYPIETSRLLVDTDRTRDLDHAIELMAGGDDAYDYSVAWIDLLARGRFMGRSVLTRGRFARREELPPALRTHPLAYEGRQLANVPPVFPSGLLNPWSVRLFNEFWYRKAPACRRGEIQDIPTFFHPLDMIGNWNLIYGPRGFIQWQCVVPEDAVETLRDIVRQLSDAGCTSFLAVLKRFGPGNEGHLSFPIAGWTLSLDIPVGDPRLATLLDRLDEQVAAEGGRIYLAKDSRLRRELLEVMYPRLDEWRRIRDTLDPNRLLRSDLGRRLGLCPD
ncbi:MAG: FAD-binding oxidoreductase [Acidimicrobiales bacterium]|nr:FAD-binding oxidoreductase [Acidimicrobiales bacterium]